MPEDTLHFGFKKISSANWQEPDLPTYNPGLTDDFWIPEVLKPQLDPRVPEEVRRLFEAGRSLFIYGYFFYPLLTIATEHILRIAEAAVAAKCAALGLPGARIVKKGHARRFTFADNIQRLIQAGVILKPDEAFWGATRKLRNMASHLEQQSILSPGMVLGDLRLTAEQINKLFN